ncbi:MAG TPA: ABC transporter permease [Methylomirabilota bacterium]|nr:ABC transporter permease [Methylomirabilota bacterium]
MSLFDKSEMRLTGAFLLRNKLSLAGGIIAAAYLLLAVIVALVGEHMLPYNPYAQNFGQALLPPSGTHLFGTDDLGRDIFSRVIAGAPIDAQIAFVVVLVSLALGGTLGAFAGYFGGAIEDVVMRVTDVFLAFPALVLAMAVAIAIGPGLINSMMALLVVWWPWYARIARGEALAIKNSQYMEAARAAGLKNIKIVTRHVLPNTLMPLLVYATLDISNVILTGSILSFIGLGAQPPQPEWGRMVFDGQDYLSGAWWMSVLPALAIFIVVLAFSLFGDGLRDAFDPKLRRR